MKFILLDASSTEKINIIVLVPRNYYKFKVILPEDTGDREINEGSPFFCFQKSLYSLEFYNSILQKENT